MKGTGCHVVGVLALPLGAGDVRAPAGGAVKARASGRRQRCQGRRPGRRRLFARRLGGDVLPWTRPRPEAGISHALRPAHRASAI
jgi:hypothetical protein